MGLFESIKANRLKKQKEAEIRREKEKAEYQKRLEEARKRQEEQARMMKDIRVEFAIKGREFTRRIMDRFAECGPHSYPQYGKADEYRVIVFCDEIWFLSANVPVPLDSKVWRYGNRWFYTSQFGYENISEYIDCNRKIYVNKETVLSWVAKDIRDSMQKRFTEYNVSDIKSSVVDGEPYCYFEYSAIPKQITGWS